jgi:hypothetical protein
MNSNFETQFQNGTGDTKFRVAFSEIAVQEIPTRPTATLPDRPSSARPIREHNLRDPIFQNRSLLWVQPFKLEPHTEGGIGVNDPAFGVEGALITDDLNGDSSSDPERNQGVDVASAEANLGGSCDELGPGTQLKDLD